MKWWNWARAQRALESWVRALIGERPYSIQFKAGEGSFVRFSTREIVVDPTTMDRYASALPLAWRGRSITTLASLQWNAARAFARHEAGHVLVTDPYMVGGPLHAWLANALEDERMERILGRRHRPSWGDFTAIARVQAAHWPLEDARTQLIEERLLDACLFHRWESKRPAGTPSRLVFATPADQHRWESEIRPLVEKAWEAENAQIVADLAFEILQRLGLAPTAPVPPRRLAMGVWDQRDVPASSSFPPWRGDPVPAPVAGPDVEYGDDSEPPDADADPSEGLLWMLPYADLAAEVAGDTQRLIKALRVPTPDMAPRTSLTSGTFSVRAHVRTQGEKPLVLRRDVDAGTGMAVVLLIDWTTSMGSRPLVLDLNGHPTGPFDSPRHRMPHARRAAMLLEMACAEAGIPLAIGLAGTHGELAHPGARSLIIRAGAPPVTWVRRFDTPPRAEGPKALIAGIYGVCLNERVSAALREAARQLRNRPEGHRLALYIHDGRPTDETPSSARLAVEEVRRQGIVVLGVFIGDQGDIADIEAIFGPVGEGTIPVEELSDLPARLERVLKRHARRR